MRGKGGKAGGRNSGITIIRREEVIEGGHHGGAWKVAYADFVTAMMAFFPLMWLLNATTEDQRKGLADYFSPNNLLSHASSGIGQPFGRHTVFDQGAMVSDRGAAQVIVGKRPVVNDPPDDDADTLLTADRHGAAAEAGPARKLDSGPQGPAKTTPAAPGAGTLQVAKPGATGPADAAHPSPQAVPIDMPQVTPTDMSQAARTNVAADAPLTAPTDASAGAQVVARLETASGIRAPTATDLRAENERQEKRAFEQAAAQLRHAVRDDPDLAALSRQLAIDITPEGLRIKLLDDDRLAMSATGSATPNDRDSCCSPGWRRC
jgi:chemotaxis protein MotB